MPPFPPARRRCAAAGWLPDSLERIFYLNVITLMLSVLDEMVEGMSVNFAGVRPPGRAGGQPAGRRSARHARVCV